MTNDLTTMLRAELSAIDAQAETLATRKSAILVLLDKPATVEVKPVEAKPAEAKQMGANAKDVAAKLAAARSPANPAKPLSKGRGQGRRADLSEADIAAIRERAAEGKKSFELIGAHFDVSRSTIANVVNRKGRFA